MNGKLDYRTRSLLAHYRAWPRGHSLFVIARAARSHGNQLVFVSRY
jgi:hypothetical protein|nr:hypothetical protein [Kofleriaceae bacterium]